MNDLIELQYTERLVRDAAFTFWKRTVGFGYVLALTLVGAALVFLWWRGDRSWIFGALLGVFCIAVLQSALVYVLHLRRGLAKFSSMERHAATLTCTEESFSFASSLGTTTLPWSAIKEIWQAPSFWLILFSRSQFVTLPLGCMAAEQQRRFLDRARAAGAKIS